MIDFLGTPGAVFNAWGKCGLLLKQAQSYQNALYPDILDPAAGLIAQTTADPDIEAIVGSSYLPLLAAAGDSVSSMATSVARAVLNRRVYEDNPQPGQTKFSANTTASLAELLRQMKLYNYSVRAQTVTATPSAFVGTGNGVLVASVKRPFDGRTLENAYAETVHASVTADSYTGGATAGNEPIQLGGAGAQGDLYAYGWPAGSGAFASVRAADGSATTSSGNLLTNSGWDAWTNNTPNGWTLTGGAVAGTTVFQETSVVFDAAGGSLRFLGDGVTDAGVQQTVTLTFLTQYAANLWLRRDGVAAGAGVLEVALVDGNGNVVNDAAGAPNSFTVDLTQLSTTWTAYGGAFRTPGVLPAGLSVRVRQSTPLTAGRSVYADRLALTPMTQLYVHGPYFAAFSGSVPFVLGDLATVAVTNSRGAAGTLSTFQTLAFQLFSEVRANEILLPSSATPVIPDSLIG